jgi:transposase
LPSRGGGAGAGDHAVEATGGLKSVVAASLGAAGLPVVMVNPAQVPAFAQALDKRAKKDPIAAAVIARFAVPRRAPSSSWAMVAVKHNPVLKAFTSA